jgi:RNA polymerase sigma-70 factor, ECF subfamily
MQARAQLSRDVIWNDLTVDLKKFIVRRIPNRADAEDVLQDALIKIHRHLDRLPPNSNVYAWVYQVTRNTIVDYYRQDRANLSPDSLDTSGDLPEDFAQPVVSRDAISEIAECLRPMVGCLPEKYREALVLADFEGITQAELAARLGLSLSGAKSRVQRARAQLKALLLQCCYLEFDCRGRLIDYQAKNPCKC